MLISNTTLLKNEIQHYGQRLLHLSENGSLNGSQWLQKFHLACGCYLIYFPAVFSQRLEASDFSCLTLSTFKKYEFKKKTQVKIRSRLKVMTVFVFSL